MSGSGAPSIAVEGAEGLRVAVIASRWHDTIMDGLLDGARRALGEARVTRSTEVRVPGVFELTVAASRIARHGEVDALRHRNLLWWPSGRSSPVVVRHVRCTVRAVSLH